MSNFPDTTFLYSFEEWWYNIGLIFQVTYCCCFPKFVRLCFSSDLLLLLSKICYVIFFRLYFSSDLLLLLSKICSVIFFKWLIVVAFQNLLGIFFKWLTVVAFQNLLGHIFQVTYCCCFPKFGGLYFSSDLLLLLSKIC